MEKWIEREKGVDIQAPLHGYSLFADNLMITLFSAPGYKVIYPSMKKSYPSISGENSGKHEYGSKFDHIGDIGDYD